MQGKHITYPELLKNELDTITRHGYEVVDVEDNKLLLEESSKTYNFLLDTNTREIREYFKDTDCGYVELEVVKKHFRPLGLTFTKVSKPTRDRANYLLIKSPRREDVFMYKERLRELHDEAMKHNLILSIIYALFLGSILLLQNRVVKNLTIWGYYAFSLIVIGLFITAFYRFLRHKGMKEDA